MLNRPRRHSVAAASALLLLGGASTCVAQDARQQKTVESLSASAYQRIAPRLAALKAGDRITSTIEWDFFKLQQGGRVVPFAAANGWVDPLSGGFMGALSGFGRLIGQTGNVLLGEHVFGYLLGATLVPRHVVRTQATSIAADEYDRLRKEKRDGLGWADAPQARPTRLYYRDVTVRETQPLTPSEPGHLDGTRPSGTLREALRSHTTAERFKVAERLLASLAPGTGYWEALGALHMTMTTLDSGITYEAWLADGHLGKGWAKLTPEGYFEVLRFGYFQDDKEMSRLALIFKNGRVHKVVPEGTQDEIQRHFD